MQNLTERIDELFAQNKGKEAEELLESCLRTALQEGRTADAVPILNELIGYCRETSQKEKSYEYADLVLILLDRMQLQGTIPYATTLLNIANAYRAGGRLEDSLKVYGQVEEIYRKNLKADDMLFANLYNNISLLYQELDRFEQAREALFKALAIVENRKDTAFEVAVTYANLAATDLKLGLDEEAEKSFNKSIQLFEENQIQDTHYCAAVSALATFHYHKGDYQTAEKYFLKAMKGIEAHLGENEYYMRMKENAEICRQACEKAGRAQEPESEADIKGLELCRAYYETYGKPMLEEKFPGYLNRIAVGLVGEGSDCFGYDDAVSRDHDWGPGFCMWVTEETYRAIGRELEEAYDALPGEFRGYSFKASVQGQGRRGVHIIEVFYKKLLGQENFPAVESFAASVNTGEDFSENTAIDRCAFRNAVRWDAISDASLAAALNGAVFTDPEGIFSAIRCALREEYPERLRYLKIAECAARFCQNGQYNVPRMSERGDKVTARLLLGEAVKEAFKLLYYVDGEVPPHDKWLLRGLQDKENSAVRQAAQDKESRAGRQTSQDGSDYAEILDSLEKAVLCGSDYLETAADQISHLLYRKGYISDTESYLDVHVAELLFKARIVDLDVEELAEKIARCEFEAFDKVQNLGGRADCQDDWFTFSIMRISQYLTWNKTMLVQYYYDFSRELERGHNLIEEKYGRMMESTAPAEYEMIREHFPELSPQKKEIIETIVAFQVKWMEEFAAEYPCLAGNARSIHTYEDTPWNTSYETYLRGEISTYSDRMLELYGRYIVELSRGGENPAKKIMKHSVLMYGYDGLDEAEAGLRREN